MPLRKNPNEDLERLRHAGEQARRPHVREWWLNIAHWDGQQYVEWSPSDQNIRLIPRKPHHARRPRPVVNKIRHFVSQQHSNALQTRPTADVLPATDDTADISDAQVGRAYLDWVFDVANANFDRQLSDATNWALITGNGYLMWYWNKELKRPDICAPNPFEMVIDPYAVDFNKARWIIRQQYLDPEEVYNRYGKEVPANRRDRADLLRTELLRHMGRAPVLDGVLVNELWHLPTRRHPEGLFTVWSEKETLVPRGAFPYEHKSLPFSQIGVIENPGSPYYISNVKDLRSPQMELNKYHAQRIRVRENYASHKWYIPAEIELEQLPNDDPDQVLVGSSSVPGARPEIIEGRGFPDNNEGQWIGEEMMNVVGLHEVSQAQVPGRVESSKAIELLKEADASRLAVLLETTKQAIAKGGAQILALARQYAPEEDVVATYSREGVPQVRRFRAREWKPGMRVRVTMGTGLARSRAARQDQVMTLVQQGVLTDPERIAELLEVPLPTMISAKAFDIKLARNENFLMLEGTPIKPNSWDDHEIHLREHNNQRKSSEYLEADTKAKKVFEMHCRTHEQLQEAELLKLAKRQAIMQQLLGEQPGQPAPEPGAATAGQTTPNAAPAEGPV